MIGVRADGRKELIALADGYRELAESWADLLRDWPCWACAPPCWPSGTGRWGSGTGCGRCSRRPGRAGAGSTRRPTRAAPPKSAPRGRRRRWRRSGAPRTSRRVAAVTAFESSYGAKFPKATAKITDHAEELLAFFDYPCEHGFYLRKKNIESNFATVKALGQDHQLPRVAGRRAGDGIQADRVLRKTAGAPSTPPTSSPGWCSERPSSTETIERPGERPSRKPLKDLDPQVLRIARSARGGAFAHSPCNAASQRLSRPQQGRRG